LTGIKGTPVNQIMQKRKDESKVLGFKAPQAAPERIRTTSAAMPPVDPSDILTIDEVAAKLKVSRRVVYGLTRVRSQNCIPHFHVGQAVRFNWLSVSEWTRRGQKAA
jgi:excisionase family DNA binding protein